eukprot:5811326-Pleurochrysis_carterae.AAC.1
MSANTQTDRQINRETEQTDERTERQTVRRAHERTQRARNGTRTQAQSPNRQLSWRISIHPIDHLVVVAHQAFAASAGCSLL